MKYLGIAFALLLGTALSAQSDITAGFTLALQKGNAAKLASYFGPNVDITVLGEEGTMSAAAAQKSLDNFFRGHAPKSFKIMHKGTSKLDDHYRIGDLVCADGTYRVTFFMHRTDAGMQVKQLRIESFEEDDF